VALFTGTHVNKLDKKGRVSVPASFRAALTGLPFAGVHAYPSRAGVPAIECCGADWMERLRERIGSFEPEDAEGLKRAMAVFSNTHDLPFDPEGRITLPPKFIQHAGLDGQIAFVGIGHIFQIWEPSRFEQFSNGGGRA
jgi:MraZ protein